MCITFGIRLYTGVLYTMQDICTCMYRKVGPPYTLAIITLHTGYKIYTPATKVYDGGGETRAGRRVSRRRVEMKVERRLANVEGGRNVRIIRRSHGIRCRTQRGMNGRREQRLGTMGNGTADKRNVADVTFRFECDGSPPLLTRNIRTLLPTLVYQALFLSSPPHSFPHFFLYSKLLFLIS